MTPKTRPESHTEVFLHFVNGETNNCLRQNGSMEFREMKRLWMVYRAQHNVSGTFVHALVAMSNQRLMKSYSDKIMEDLNLSWVYLTDEGIAKLFGREAFREELRLKKAFLRNCEKLTLDCNGITITSAHQDSRGQILLPNVNVGKAAEVRMTVKNMSLQSCRLKTCMLLGRTEGFSLEGGGPCDLLPFRSKEVKVLYDGNSDPSRVQVIVGFEFCMTVCPHDPFHIVRIINVRIVDDLVLTLSGLASNRGYRARPHRRINRPLHGEDGRRPPMPSGDQLSLDENPLRRYTETWLSAQLECHSLWLPARTETGRLRSKHLNEEQRRLLESDLGAETYMKQFLLELLVEQRQQEVDIHNYDREKVIMQISGHRKYLILEVPGLAENRPSLLKKDFLIAVDPDNGRRFKGYVHMVNKETVHLQFSERFHDNFINGQPYDIEFSLNPTTFRMQCRAIAMAEENFGRSHYNFLFPDERNLAVSLGSTTNIRWFDGKVASNPQQMTAIRHIIDKTSGHAPYLVFGPPGTGKTVTVVEAIKQVYSQKRGSHILACTPSNSAADLIVHRLVKDGHVHKRDIIRLNAYSRFEGQIADDICDDIMSVSLYDRDCGSFFFPSLDAIKQKRIVVCTLYTSGRLVSAGMPREHFDYIFVDESGHAVEPECLIPIAGMLNAGHAQLVLAGDPQQLGPIVRSTLAKKSGLAMSLLERLMKCSLYRKSTTIEASASASEGCYNERAVTKLLQNYRSHPAILHVPNKLFYDNELQVCADELVRECLCNWEDLAKEARAKRFPIVFHGVVGKDMQTENSPSFFNPEEVRQVVNYIKMLRECRSPTIRSQDIGVISPYHLQVIHIRNVLKGQHFDEVKVGSVEEFQGQERLVIIISTVRSQQSFLPVDEKFSLGFLRQRKRFNVAITRAKALLIVIGNPMILIKDDNWKCFIEHCQANGACKGVLPPGSDEKDIVDGLQQLNLKSEEDILRNAELRLAGADLREDAGWRQQENPE